jgi:hypothetical protein
MWNALLQARLRAHVLLAMEDPHVDAPLIAELRDDPERRSSACRVLKAHRKNCVEDLRGALDVCILLLFCPAYLVLLLIKEALEELGLEHSAAVFNQEIGVPVNRARVATNLAVTHAIHRDNCYRCETVRAKRSCARKPRGAGGGAEVPR